MRQISIIILAISIFTACNSKKYQPSALLNETEEYAIKLELARNIEKLAPRTSMEQRWDTTAYRVAYYKEKADSMKIVCYQKGKDGYHYYLITRIVPSVRAGERRGSVGRFHWNAETKRLSDLEEYLLTNILPPAKIEEAATGLFESSFEKDTLPAKFAHQELVEWPNEYFGYDKKNHSWDRRVYFQPVQ